MPHRVYIGIGSNQGKKKENYLKALDRIAKIPKTRITRESSFYESEPLGNFRGSYINGAIEIETELGPELLLKKCKDIEQTMGRKKVRKPWGARSRTRARMRSPGSADSSEAPSRGLGRSRRVTRRGAGIAAGSTAITSSSSTRIQCGLRSTQFQQRL